MKENGKYQKNCRILLAHIYNLCALGELKVCKATTQRLTQCFEQPISTRQVSRYLKTLRSEGLIKVSTTPLQKDKKTKSLYKLREIKVVCSEPKEAQEVSRMALQIPEYKFMAQTKVKKASIVSEPKRGTVKVLNFPISEVKEAPKRVFRPVPEPEPEEDFEPTPTPETNWDEIDRQMLAMGYEKMIHPCQREARYLMIENPGITMEEAIEMQIAKDAEQAEEEFQFKTRMAWEAYVKENATPLVRTISSDFNADDDPLEALWKAHLETKARVDADKEWMAKEEKKDYTEEQWNEIVEDRLYQELEALADNTKYQDGKWILTVYLGGIFNKETDLLTYMNWNANSPEFKIFKTEYAKMYPGEYK